ncbi:MAG TPA: glycosyl hydrolase family 65 protein [Actinopolymorphaceae bacterium]
MNPHVVRFGGYDPDDEGRREALCTLGNGYLATRGAAPESRADTVHYPGTYVAGFYNRLTSTVAGGQVENESMVNLPNGLFTTFRLEDGPWFDLGQVDILGHEQDLDLDRGMLVRRVRFRDHHGRTTRLIQRRLVHNASPHLAGLQTTLVAEDWTGRVTARSGIDTRITNSGVSRYRGLATRHLVDGVDSEVPPDIVLHRARTSQSGRSVAIASRTRAWQGAKAVESRRRYVREDGIAAHEITVDLAAGQVLRLDKIVAIHTSTDHAITEPASEAVDLVRRAGDFDDLLPSHAHAWTRLWALFRIGLSASPSTQQAIRLHLFHLLQTLSPHTADLDTGVPARGLHGEAYRGLVFWDELFVLPTLTMRLPHLSRSLLLYRYRRLDQARLAARAAGHDGAMFPWQSGSNGRDESQRLHLNPRSGRWLPDHTYLQRHVGIAVAYNTWQYYQATGDLEFLTTFGAEMILEITRFFASLCEYDHERDRYVIRGVVGPDEYHTGYPDHDRPGIDNNAYTNLMVAWLCRTALELVDELPADRRTDIAETLGLRPGELDHWRHIGTRMFVPFHGDGIISQFEGYEKLAELDWEAYRERYGDIRRLDRILEAEGDDPNRYKASKQADVLMLFYLLSAEELGELLRGLGYPMPRETIPANVDYYLQRTSHGSTLSSVVHSWVSSRGHRDRAVEFFDEALASDIHDTQGGTTAEGIHLAAMVGSVDLLQRCFAGLAVRRGVLWLNPHWPSELGELAISIRFRGQPIGIRVSGRSVTVSTAPWRGFPMVTCACRDRTVRLGPGETAHFPA